MTSRIKINETFYSIQGESSFSGHPTFFIRTTACNLRCTYCDSKYSYFDGVFRTLESLLEEAKTYASPYVCLTGGEPLIQSASTELMRHLCDLDKKVSLETSGSFSIREVDPRVKIILDVKTPDSGAPESFLMDNLQWALPHTEFKFVITSERDFEWAEQFSRQYLIQGNFLVLYSPSYGEVSPKWLSEKILQANSTARLQLQLHKYIWSADTRGV